MLLALVLPRSALRPTRATLEPAFPNPSATAPPSTPVPPMATATASERSKISPGFIGADSSRRGNEAEEAFIATSASLRQGAHIVTATDPERGLQSAATQGAHHRVRIVRNRGKYWMLLRTEVRAPVAMGRCALRR